MALSGNLRDFNLPDVFQLVSFSRKTGVLNIVRDDAAQGAIYFKDGEVFFATSNWNRDPLGLRLVKARQITQKQLEQALAKQLQTGEDLKRLGHLLVDEGFVSAKTLEAFVQEQIQDTIFDLMRWDEGQFDFKPTDVPSDEDIGLTVSIENIIMEGSRRLEEWTRIKKKIPSLDIVFKMATAPGEGTFEISLKPSEWRLITIVDGTRDIERLARDLGFNDFEVCRILYGMYSAGLLEVVTGEELENLRMEQAKKKARAASEAAAAELKKQAEDMQPEAPVIQLVRPEAEEAAAAEAAAEAARAEAEAAATAAAQAEANARAAAEEAAAEATAEEARAAAARAEAEAAAAAEVQAQAAVAEAQARAAEAADAQARAAAAAQTEGAILEEPGTVGAPGPMFGAEAGGPAAEPALEEPTAASEAPPAFSAPPEPAPQPEVLLEEPEVLLEEPAAQAEVQAEPVAQEVAAPAEGEAAGGEPSKRPERVEKALSELLAEMDETPTSASEFAMADELSALTGVQVGRQQRQAEVEPDQSATPGFHRDHAITKETVLKIIDGLKSL